MVGIVDQKVGENCNFLTYAADLRQNLDRRLQISDRVNSGRRALKVSTLPVNFRKQGFSAPNLYLLLQIFWQKSTSFNNFLAKNLGWAFAFLSLLKIKIAWSSCQIVMNLNFAINCELLVRRITGYSADVLCWFNYVLFMNTKRQLKAELYLWSLSMWLNHSTYIGLCIKVLWLNLVEISNTGWHITCYV